MPQKVVPHRQRGQAIALGIATMLLGTVLTLLLFNTAQLTTEKMRLTNAVDAAAYSGMVWEARALNFHAYTNRAMVANQVAIAQVVSWVSWTRYAKVLTYNANNTLGYIPIFRPFTQGAFQAATTINTVVERIAPIAVRAMDGLLTLLASAQTAVHVASAATAREIVTEVLGRNDPQYAVTGMSDVFYGAHAVNWWNFASRYGGGNRPARDNELRRQADIIMSARNQVPAGAPPSRDEWARDRGWSEDLDWLAIILGVPPQWAWTANIDLVKAGETRLLERETDAGELEWDWKAKDTLSFHVSWRSWGCRRLRCGWRSHNFELPVGWAGADASTRFDNGVWSRNRRAERYIATDFYLPGMGLGDVTSPIPGYNGVRPYYEIANLDDNNRDPRLALAVEAAKPGPNVRTTTKLGIGSPADAVAARNGIGAGMFRVADRFAGDRMRAISKAEVYFRRPVARADGREEYGNLYNPYWDVRLVSARTERLMSWGAEGLGDAASAASASEGDRAARP